MKLREAVIADIPELHRVRMAVKENALSNPDLITPADYASFLTEKGKGWLVEDEGQVLGFAIVDLEGRNVWALFVDPPAEGRGIGRQLHHTMMNWYFQQTDQAIWLSTAPGSRAERFYRKAGWIEAGTYGKGEIRFELKAGDWLNER
jgi:GNAT superfamily N-acetyltransferase